MQALTLIVTPGQTVKTDMTGTLTIANGFDVREILKANGFTFDGDSKLWKKDFPVSFGDKGINQEAAYQAIRGEIEATGELIGVVFCGIGSSDDSMVTLAVMKKVFGELNYSRDDHAYKIAPRREGITLTPKIGE